MFRASLETTCPRVTITLNHCCQLSPISIAASLSEKGIISPYGSNGANSFLSWVATPEEITIIQHIGQNLERGSVDMITVLMLRILASATPPFHLVDI